MEAEQAVVQPLIEAARPCRALDVGTGTGRYLSVLQAAGARVVVGLDMSMAMLARTTPALPRICGDACRLPFRDASFDVVCSSLMVGDVADLASWIREAARMLVPGGQLIYSDFHPAWTAERWRRTFRTVDGRLCELSFYPHAIEDQLSLIEAAGLAVRTIREPRIAGRPAPVVVVFHAMKAGCRRRATA
jgi:malonyl-CoA O-methyltransferase